MDVIPIRLDWLNDRLKIGSAFHAESRTTSQVVRIWPVSDELDSTPVHDSVRRRGKKITTRRREGVGVVVEKKKVYELLCALFITN